MSGCFRQPGMEHAGVRAHCWIGIPHKKGCTAYVGQPWKTLRFGEHLHLFNFGPYAHWATCRQSTCENRFLVMCWACRIQNHPGQISHRKQSLQSHLSHPKKGNG